MKARYGTIGCICFQTFTNIFDWISKINVVAVLFPSAALPFVAGVTQTADGREV